MRAPAGEAVVVIFVRQPVAPAPASRLLLHPPAGCSLIIAERFLRQPPAPSSICHTLVGDQPSAALSAACPPPISRLPSVSAGEALFFTSRSGPCGRGRPPRRMRWTSGTFRCAGGGSHRPHGPDRLVKREPLPPSFSAKPRASPCARIHDQKANVRDRRLWHDLRASCAAVTSTTWCFPDVFRAEAWKTCHRLRSRPGGSVSSKRTSRGALAAVPGSSCGRATLVRRPPMRPLPRISSAYDG